MSTISIGRAVGAGSRLIAREPAAFAAWCAIYFVASAGPLLLSGGELLAMYRSMGQGGTPVMPRFQPLSILVSLGMIVVLPAAVFRAALTPNERRFAYLRVGRRELWMVLNTLAMLACGLVVWFGTMLIMGVLVAGGAFVAQGAPWVLGVLMVVLYPFMIAFWIWPFLRLSMAPVMAFEDRKLRIVESWRLTRGHAWRLFLVALLLGVILVAAEMVLLAIGAFALGGAETMAILSSNPGALMARMTLPGLIVAAAVGSVFGVGAYAVGGAAWADMYRQIRPRLDETFA